MEPRSHTSEFYSFDVKNEFYSFNVALITCNYTYYFFHAVSHNFYPLFFIYSHAITYILFYILFQICMIVSLIQLHMAADKINECCIVAFTFIISLILFHYIHAPILVPTNSLIYYYACKHPIIPALYSH